MTILDSSSLNRHFTNFVIYSLPTNNNESMIPIEQRHMSSAVLTVDMSTILECQRSYPLSITLMSTICSYIFVTKSTLTTNDSDT